jgi:hypothetical protein
MRALPPAINIRAALGTKIPGGGTIYVPQAPKSPTIGECIYCGNKSGLTDEHTIPFALFGMAILKKASCRDCAAKTQKVEQRLLRDTFGQVREYLQFPTRKARKSRRWSGTRPVTDKRTGDVFRRPLAEGIIALYLVFPDYLPRALGAEPAEERHGKRSVAVIHLNDVKSLERDRYEEGWTKFNSADIERCIAKIALCEAIREIDQSIRDPVLSRFILEGQGDSSEFLGAIATHDITNQMHRVFYHRLTRGRRDIGLMTTVELFSFLPSPSYKVLVRPVGQISYRPHSD